MNCHSGAYQLWCHYHLEVGVHIHSSVALKVRKPSQHWVVVFRIRQRVFSPSVCNPPFCIKSPPPPCSSILAFWKKMHHCDDSLTGTVECDGSTVLLHPWFRDKCQHRDRCNQSHDHRGSQQSLSAFLQLSLPLAADNFGNTTSIMKIMD